MYSSRQTHYIRYSYYTQVEVLPTPTQSAMQHQHRNHAPISLPCATSTRQQQQQQPKKQPTQQQSPVLACIGGWTVPEDAPRYPCGPCVHVFTWMCRYYIIWSYAAPCNKNRTARLVVRMFCSLTAQEQLLMQSVATPPVPARRRWWLRRRSIAGGGLHCTAGAYGSVQARQASPSRCSCSGRTFSKNQYTNRTKTPYRHWDSILRLPFPFFYFLRRDHENTSCTRQKAHLGRATISWPGLFLEFK